MIKEKKHIYWPLVGIYIIQEFLVDITFFYFISLGIMLYFIVKNNFKMSKPRIKAFIPYILIILLSTLIGLILYDFRFVYRDLFYATNNLILIYSGYLFYRKEKSFDNIIATIFTMISVVSIITLIYGTTLTIRDMSFISLRLNFQTGVKSIEAFLSFFWIYIFILKNTIFTKRMDKIFLIIMLLQAILNMSRLTMLGIFVGFMVAIFGTYKAGLMSFRSVKKIFGLLAFIFLILLIAYFIVPKNISESFIIKIINSTNEINSRGTFDTATLINENWRGYENYSAVNQWKQSNVLQKFFGAGLGKLIHMDTYPSQWKDLIENQNGISGVTLLHNTYLMLLIKEGIIGLFSFIIFFVSNLLYAYRSLKKKINSEGKATAILLMILIIIMMIDAYVVRGMMQQDAQLCWSLCFGWCCAKLIHVSKEQVE